MNHLFSIITITKDNPKDFIYTAESIICQTYKNYEWIVIDSSQNNTARQIVKNYEKNIDLLYFSEARGIANAWNIGIKKANGKFIFILNSGDSYEKYFLQNYKSFISQDQDYIYCSNVKTLYPSRKKIKSKFPAKPWALWRGMHIAHCSICMPKLMYDKYGYYPEIEDAMDFALFAKIFKLEGEKIFKIIPVRSYALYTLGGHSELNYFKGLNATKKINIKNGMNPFLANIMASIYKIKFIIFKIKDSILKK